MHFFRTRQKNKKDLSLITLHQPQILILEASIIKAIQNDLYRYQMGLCHMNGKSKSKQRVQYQIIVEVTSFVRSEGEYVNGDTKATSKTGLKMQFLSPFFFNTSLLNRWFRINEVSYVSVLSSSSTELIYMMQ